MAVRGLSERCSRDRQAFAARGAADQLETSVEIPGRLYAPVSAAAPVAQAITRAGDEIIATTDLYSVIDIPEGSLMQSAWDEVLLWFE